MPQSGERLSKGNPTVTSSQGKFFLVMGGIVLLLFVIFSTLFGGGDEEKTGPLEERTIARQATQPPPPPIEDTPPPPPPNFIEDPGFDAPPPAPPPVGVFVDDDVDNELRKERLRSEMLQFDGGLTGNAFTDDSAAREEARRQQFSSSDPNLAFASAATQPSPAPQELAGRIENIHATIAQGKLIHAVLETAVNTQLPGNVRAIVSRDIYAEAGRTVLIPKGSRLVGVYNTNLFQGQDRVFIVWNRVIRPDGIDMMINSTSVDSLGRSGIEGYVDNRYGQMFSAAALSSIISIGVAVAAEEIAGEEDGNIQQSVAPDGTFTTQSTSSTQAAVDAAARIGSVGSRITDRVFDFRPRVVIDQGTQVKVFVNRDLIFPSELTSGTRILP